MIQLPAATPTLGPISTALPADDREIECLWDDGTIVPYPASERPFSPVAWRYPRETTWTKLREIRE